ncbi:MFS transporter [Glycomyces harbinensis]|uniref:Drug resistance transporter, EmrB/QacA subfamily n=1 Tax=Glycomyces harbinensis TaxID=58114 RepID=A0A1G6XBU3_9ACTN|nr:MFS transporter [Glycomyces harbinensis]SDD74736.1 drug resistance transporter, EmrB/QacA subfamily [Glycomyces harbinensis]
MSTAPVRSLRSRWLAVIALSAAQVMIVLDQNIVTIALPAIREDLAFSQANLVWTVNAYVIPFGGLLLLAGRLGDLISRKQVFLAGLALFVAASVAAALADSQSLLLGARFVQGIGGAITAAGLLGMIVTIFPEPHHQVKAIGVYGFASAGGGALGSVIGGVLTETLGWESVFYVNLPLGIFVAVLAWKLLPAERGVGLRAGADVLGAALVTAGLMLAVYTLVETERYGWTSARTIGLGALAALLLAGFAVRQAKAAAPLIPPRILRSRNVSGANIAQALMVGSAFGFMFFTVLYLQQVLGFEPLAAGLAFLPAPVVIAVVSMAVSPRLLTRFGARPMLLVGLSLMAAGFLLFAQMRADGSFLVDVLPGMVTAPLGFGLAMPALMTLGMADSRPEDAGVTSGLFNTAQQVGGAVGLAVASTVVAARSGALQDQGASTAEALTGGFRAGYLVGTAFALIALVIVITVIKARKPEAADAENVEAVPAAVL